MWSELCDSSFSFTSASGAQPRSVVLIYFHKTNIKHLVILIFFYTWSSFMCYAHACITFPKGNGDLNAGSAPPTPATPQATGFVGVKMFSVCVSVDAWMNN